MTNEKTSKRIASKAGKFLAVTEHTDADIDAMIGWHERSITYLKRYKRLFADAKGVAASALTQAEDKP